MMTNTTFPNDHTILLPVQDGNVANSCKQNVKFFCVQLRLDFSPLVSAGATVHSCTLLEEYYIELPQSTVSMNTGTNQAYNLTTWHGAANFNGMSYEDVRNTILQITLQDGPVDLQPAAFELTSACTKGTVLRSSIDSKS